jgi:hypothetical protein
MEANLKIKFVCNHRLAQAAVLGGVPAAESELIQSSFR